MDRKLPKEVQAELINLCLQGESERWNKYWLAGFVKKSHIYDKRVTPYREQIYKFLAETNDLTRAFFLELIYFRSEYEEIYG